MTESSGGMQHQPGEEKAHQIRGAEPTDPSLELGERIYARYGDTPGIIPLGKTFALMGRIRQFSSGRLSLLADIQRRWANSSSLPHGWSAPIYIWPFTLLDDAARGTEVTAPDVRSGHSSFENAQSVFERRPTSSKDQSSNMRIASGSVMASLQTSTPTGRPIEKTVTPDASSIRRASQPKGHLPLPHGEATPSAQSPSHHLQKADARVAVPVSMRGAELGPAIYRQHIGTGRHADSQHKTGSFAHPAPDSIGPSIQESAPQPTSGDTITERVQQSDGNVPATPERQTSTAPSGSDIQPASPSLQPQGETSSGLPAQNKVQSPTAPSLEIDSPTKVKNQGLSIPADLSGSQLARSRFPLPEGEGAAERRTSEWRHHVVQRAIERVQRETMVTTGDLATGLFRRYLQNPATSAIQSSIAARGAPWGSSPFVVQRKLASFFATWSGETNPSTSAQAAARQWTSVGNFSRGSESVVGQAHASIQASASRPLTSSGVQSASPVLPHYAETSGTAATPGEPAIPLDFEASSVKESSGSEVVDIQRQKVVRNADRFQADLARRHVITQMTPMSHVISDTGGSSSFVQRRPESSFSDERNDPQMAGPSAPGDSSGGAQQIAGGARQVEPLSTTYAGSRAGGLAFSVFQRYMDWPLVRHEVAGSQAEGVRIRTGNGGQLSAQEVAPAGYRVPILRKPLAGQVVRVIGEGVMPASNFAASIARRILGRPATSSMNREIAKPEPVKERADLFTDASVGTNWPFASDTKTVSRVSLPIVPPLLSGATSDPETLSADQDTHSKAFSYRRFVLGGEVLSSHQLSEPLADAVPSRLPTLRMSRAIGSPVLARTRYEAVTAGENSSHRDDPASPVALVPTRLQRAVSSPTIGLEERIGLPTPPTSIGSEPAMMAPQPSFDMMRLADQVYELLVRRLTSERERRGL